ncbi:MAG: helix-turn-helix transcriptional regulator [Lachnospiraceae bacterium]|nr:helix-turn-helix transcriptional regulator [Lachnospiraceae bacterium]
MFSMQDIGKRIISLRKNQNMTQVDLADKLGITYQAVSSWERGNSMPDIGKIPEIAELFQISIDELIGESKVVNAVLNISNHEQWKYENLAEEEIKEALPILKPNQITEVIDSIDKSKIKDIGMFLPFMHEEDVKEIALEAYKTGKDIRHYLPFMHEEDVKEMALEACDTGKDIRHYLPFMHEKDVKSLMVTYLQK